MTQSYPKVSILLAAYKSEMLLEKVFIPSFVAFNSRYWNEDDKYVGPQLVIYDNGNNGDLEKFKKLVPSCDCGFESIKIIGQGKNIGLNAALNRCADNADGTYYYLPHTDMYLMPNWDLSLLNAIKNHPLSSWLICSRSVEPTLGHTSYHIIKNYGQEWSEFDEKTLLDDFKTYKDQTIVSGYRMPFFLHKTLWDKMKGVDEKLFSYCTDDDLVQTAYDVGVRKFWLVYDSLVYHLQGKSNQQQTIDKDSMKPYEYFVEKWKKKGYYDACHPGQWHSRLIPWYIKVR